MTRLTTTASPKKKPSSSPEKKSRSIPNMKPSLTVNMRRSWPKALKRASSSQSNNSIFPFPSGPKIAKRRAVSPLKAAPGHLVGQWLSHCSRRGETVNRWVLSSLFHVFGVAKIFQTRTVELPSDSNFAVAMINQRQAAKEEQQRIKNLVLNYDLRESEDQDGE